MTEQQKKPTVLVVDDHIPAAEMVSRLFQARGYETICVYSGAEALEKARQHVPDLILLDIMMPGMDGYQVLEALRAHSSTAKIPVIFITAKDTPKDVEEGLRLGADDYIPKPVKPRELMARAKSKIEAQRLRDALERRTTDLAALLRVSEELNNHLEVSELMDLVLYLVLDLIPCEATAIYRVSEQQELLDTRLLKKNQDTAVEVDETMLLDHITEDSGTLQWDTEAQSPYANLSCGIAMPLQHGSQFHGILLIMGNQPFDEHAVRLFEAISRQATLALRNAELYAVKVNYAEHLEEMVEERTAELRSAQDLLIRAEKLASVGRLAAGIAHEINNPLLPIRVNLELIQEDLQKGNSISLSDVEEALHSVIRISKIVERLQQFTRKRAEEMPDMEPLTIINILKTVVALSRNFMEKGGIEINMDVDEQARIYGNRDQLEQVFLNIILNAAAAMHGKKGGALTIKSREEDGQLYLSFQDTGHGIREDLLDKIFEPFISTKDDGSGLGLFISYGIIQNHNGRIDVQSEVGVGTTFTLQLPLIKEAQRVN